MCGLCQARNESCRPLAPREGSLSRSERPTTYFEAAATLLPLLAGVPGPAAGNGVPGRTTSDERAPGERGVLGVPCAVAWPYWLIGLLQPARADGGISASVGGGIGSRVYSSRAATTSAGV